jgi:hypothetical protein
MVKPATPDPRPLPPGVTEEDCDALCEALLAICLRLAREDRERRAVAAQERSA